VLALLPKRPSFTTACSVARAPAQQKKFRLESRKNAEVCSAPRILSAEERANGQHNSTIDIHHISRLYPCCKAASARRNWRWVVPINADVARRTACDAELIPIVLDTRAESLNIGRASRTVPATIRRAVILRDGGRVVPTRWCDIHHVVHWADHGTTSIDNCVALCGHHHRLIHHSHRRIDIRDNIPQFHPYPCLADPTPQSCSHFRN
jgi:hypothetical protein